MSTKNTFCSIHKVKKDTNNKGALFCKKCYAQNSKNRLTKLRQEGIQKLGGNCLYCSIEVNEKTAFFVNEITQLNIDNKTLNNTEMFRSSLKNHFLCCSNCFSILTQTLKDQNNLLHELSENQNKFNCLKHGKVEVKEYLDKNNVCKKCAHQDYLRVRYRKSKNLAIERLGGSCFTCGYKYNPVPLSVRYCYNHEILSSNIFYSKRETMLREIEQAYLVCQNCIKSEPEEDLVIFKNITKTNSLIEDIENRPEYIFEWIKEDNFLTTCISAGVAEDEVRNILHKSGYTENSGFNANLNGPGIITPKFLKKELDKGNIDLILVTLNKISKEQLHYFLEIFYPELQILVSEEPKNKANVTDQQNETEDKHVWPPDRKTLKKEIWEMSTVNVAKKYGVTDTSVSRLCKKYAIKKPSVGYWAKKYSEQGINFNPKKDFTPPIEKEKLANLYKENGYVINNLAKALNIHRETASRWLAFYNITKKTGDE